jgi:hypothetical protein
MFNDNLFTMPPISHNEEIKRPMKSTSRFLKFEHKQKALQPYPLFLVRLTRYFLISMALVILSIAIGCVGYHYVGKLSWVDAFYNSSMILTGMGPVAAMTTKSAKIFSSFYALYSGIAFLSTMVIILAPVVHRFLHIFHIEEKDVD